MKPSLPLSAKHTRPANPHTIENNGQIAVVSNLAHQRKRPFREERTFFRCNYLPDCPDGIRQALSWSPTGRLRMRLPVAANTALMNAGANGGTPGSPTPLEGSSIVASMM